MPFTLRSALLSFLLAQCISMSSAQDPGPTVSDFPVGNFRSADGSYLAFFQPSLGYAFLNYETGRMGVLHGAGKDVFTAGPGALGTDPVEVEIRFERDGQNRITRAVYSDSSGTGTGTFVRQPLPVVSDHVIRSGDVAIAARLSLPDESGPFPAIVMNHGGGPGVRDDLTLWTWFFTRIGYAVVTYDKRGSGETTGDDWRTFEDLADDAVSVTRWTKAHPATDSSKVGMWAYSQSGWVAPLAASREPVAFILAVSIPAVSPAARAVASVGPRLMADGFTQEQAKAAEAFIHTANAFGRGEIDWSSYERILEESRSAAWFNSVEKPTTKEAPSRPFYTSRFGRYFDPLTYWEQLDTPVLAVYGGLDTTVPADLNAPLLQRRLSGNPDATVIILPNANHQMLIAQTGGDAELINLNTYVQGYFDLLVWYLSAL